MCVLRFRRRGTAVLAMASAACIAASSARAQVAAVPAPISPLPAPSIELVHPAPGSTIPSDRPTVFFRYGPGVASDPIEDGSFQLWVDGIERSSGFRVGNGEAWGVASDRPLTPGAHLVIARVCSVRGVCAAANNIVVAVPTAPASPNDSGRPPAARQRADSAHVKRHNHLKQPLTLLGDLVMNIAKLFRR